MLNLRTAFVVPDLAQWEVHAERGFLPDPDPLLELPPEYAAWERINRELPGLLAAGSGAMLRSVGRLPVLELAGLQTAPMHNRAMVLLSVLAHAFVWVDPQQPRKQLPAAIALPLGTLAAQLGRPPICTHATTVLHNWRRLDPSGPIELGNVATLAGFFGGLDEAWFFLVTLAVEARGAPAVVYSLQLQAAVLALDVEAATEVLERMHATLLAMMEALRRMHERCAPFVFFNRLRPFLAGWKDEPLLPDGLIYEGMGVEPRQYFGASAAQSALFPLFDEVLGVTHDPGHAGGYLGQMRSYMLGGHRRLLEYVAAGPSVRHWLQRLPEGGALRTAYNLCVAELGVLRTLHMRIAAEYIVAQARAGTEARGTGSTTVIPFLKSVRDETAASAAV